MARFDEDEIEMPPSSDLELGDLPSSEDESMPSEYDASEEIAQEVTGMPFGMADESMAPPPAAAPKSALDKYQDYMKEYGELQKKRSRNNDIADLLEISAGMGTALAGTYNPYMNLKLDHTPYDRIRSRNDRPVKDFEDKQEVQKKGTAIVDDAELRDPASKISRTYRDYAKTKLKIDLQDDVSAFDIQNLLKINKTSSGSGIFKPQQTDYLSKITGNPVIFRQDINNGAGGFVDGITGETLDGQTGVVRKVLSKDAMGNLNYMAGPGNAPVMGLSSQAKETDVNKLNEEYTALKSKGTEFRPDDRQLKAIDSEKSRLDKLTEGAKNQMNAANSVLHALDSNSKLSLSVVKARMPRVMGEVGNLNQSEQEMWQGSQAWLDRVNQYLSTISTSELTDGNKQELKKLLSGFSQDAHDSYSKIRANSSNSLSAYGVPPQYMSKIYGELPVPKSVEKLIKRDGDTKAPEGKVRVMNLETKQEGFIPKDKLKDAVKSGKYQEVK